MNDERLSASDAMRRVADSTGNSYQAISKGLGRKPNYMSNTFNSGRVPSIESYANMLGVCGYGLYAIPDGETVPDTAIRIDSGE